MSSRRTISNTFTVTTMDEPVSVQAQYSPDKTVVHTVWQDGDIYMRTKQSNETTWSSWHKIVGESGGETDYQFALSANLVTQDGTSATAPSDISSSSWQDAPMATTTQKPYLWSKVQKKDGNGNNVGSATYIRLTGEEGKDGLSPNPNILLRTVFDRGIDKVKEKWIADWSHVGIDDASDTIVDGRKSIRINASSFSTYIDFSQDVYGKLKTSTWYTLSFDFFSTHNFTTYIWDGNNSSGIVDKTAGCYIDGVFQSLDLGIDGSHKWTAQWGNEKRHSISFKTKSSFGTEHAYIMFRCPSGAQVAICMPKLELGENATTYIANEDDLVGNEGQSIRGKVGRFYYYAGEWNDFGNTDTWVVSDAQAPYFGYTPTNSTHGYYVFNPDENGTYTKKQIHDTYGDPTANHSPWIKMWDDFKYIITEAIFGSYAHFGSWVFNGDYMLSEKDADGNPRGQREYNGMGDGQLTSGFIPSTAFDALNGRASFCGDKARFQPNGAGWIANKNIQWDANGNLTIEGDIKANNGTFNGVIKTPYRDASNWFDTLEKGGCIRINDAFHGLSLPSWDSLDGVEVDIMNNTDRPSFVNNNVLKDENGNGIGIALRQYKLSSVRLQAGSRCKLKAIPYIEDGKKYVIWLILNEGNFDIYSLKDNNSNTYYVARDKSITPIPG